MFLEFFYVASYGILVAYMFRHYLFSFTAIKWRSEKPDLNHSIAHSPSVSVIIPAHNEEKVIERLLLRLTELTYPKDKVEVIVVNDESSDRTGELAEAYASRFGSFMSVVHRKPGGNGKAAVLNEGLRHAKGDVVCCIDADYVPQRSFLEKMVPYLVDSTIGAVQAKIGVLNGQASWVSKIVALERLGGCRVSQYARDRLGLVPQYAGTVGLVPRRLLLGLGGFNPDVLAEDTDLTFRLVLKGLRVKYVEHVKSLEEAVSGWRRYWRQRSRWARGHMQCAFCYAAPLLKSRGNSLRQKVDGFMLLNVYFVPILVMFSWVFSLVLFVIRVPTWFPYEIAFVSSVFFTLSGTIAPLLEIVAASICEGRKRLILLTPLLLLAYVVNVFVCSTAFLYLLYTKIAKKNPNRWDKTEHTGESR